MPLQARSSLGCPVIDLPAEIVTSQDSVIRFLIAQLVKQSQITEEQGARATCQVIKRERQGSTALGGGVALPHSKSEVSGVLRLIGRSQIPLPWEGPDGIAVHEVCLLLTPADQPMVVLQALKETATRLTGRQH